MKKLAIILLLLSVIFLCVPVFAQVETVTQETTEEPDAQAPAGRPGNVTMDFKDADIHNILRILSYKSGVNIVAGTDVEGKITIRLVDVPWERALDVILKTYDYGYEQDGNIITVTTVEKLTEQKRAQQGLEEVQPVMTEVLRLKFLDANDVKKMIEPQLSPRGRVTVLEMTGQSGWEFGSEALSKREREGDVEAIRSKTILISDIETSLIRIKEIINELDVMPAQIMIESRIMEVNHDSLRDIGLDFGTGPAGAEAAAIDTIPVVGSDTAAGGYFGGHSLGDLITPSIFGPEATAITTANSGLKLVYSKLGGSEFQMILHALEEKVGANTLSAPRIMTMDNQEASILIGTKYPILESETEEGVTSTSLDYYQDIGIQLNVIPAVAADEYISMIIHPAVTSSTSTVGDDKYPIIITREAETQIMMKSGETIAIGGLLKDVHSEARIGVPGLSKIPLLGLLFQRKVIDTEKIELLIFITAAIVKPGEFTQEELAKLYNKGTDVKVDVEDPAYFVPKNK